MSAVRLKAMYIRAERHKQLKLRSVEEGRPMTDIVEDALAAYLATPIKKSKPATTRKRGDVSNK